jgi:hypothetical protein
MRSTWISPSLASLLLAPALLVNVACEKKSEAAMQADEAAKVADAKVADLQKQLDELKAGKSTEEAAKKIDKATADHMAAAQKKALERQLADAKRRAEAKKQEAVQLAQAPAPPKEAPKPVVLEVPTGTKLVVKLNRDLDTTKDEAGAAWEGELIEDVMVDGKTAWRAGTAARGVVTQSHPAGRFDQGPGALGIRLTEIGSYGVDTDGHVVVADKKGERNAKYIAGGAALGALVGILSDKHNKDDHALGGAAVGAAAGTAVAAGTADTVVRIPASKPVTFTLTAPEKVTMK